MLRARPSRGAIRMGGNAPPFAPARSSINVTAATVMATMAAAARTHPACGPRQFDTSRPVSSTGSSRTDNWSRACHRGTVCPMSGGGRSSRTCSPFRLRKSGRRTVIRSVRGSVLCAQCKGPAVGQHGRRNHARNQPEAGRHDDGVIDRPQERNEVGNQVDWTDGVRDDSRDEPPCVPGRSRIAPNVLKDSQLAAYARCDLPERHLGSVYVSIAMSLGRPDRRHIAFTPNWRRTRVLRAMR